MGEKEAILSPYGAERIRELAEPQIDELIDGLKPLPRAKAKDAPPEVRKARSLVLCLLDDLGVKPKQGNWDAVNAYLSNPRIAGKPLYAMSEKELAACAVRLRSVIRWKADKVEKENEMAKNN